MKDERSALVGKVPVERKPITKSFNGLEEMAIGQEKDAKWTVSNINNDGEGRGPQMARNGNLQLRKRGAGGCYLRSVSEPTAGHRSHYPCYVPKRVPAGRKERPQELDAWQLPSGKVGALVHLSSFTISTSTSTSTIHLHSFSTSTMILLFSLHPSRTLALRVPDSRHRQIRPLLPR